LASNARSSIKLVLNPGHCAYWSWSPHRWWQQ